MLERAVGTVVVFLAALSLHQVHAQPSAATARESQPGLLDPANLAKPRPKPGFDVTGMWKIDPARSEGGFGDRPQNPTPATQKTLDEAKAQEQRFEAPTTYAGA